MTETHDKRTETHACDLISRQAALEALNRIEISRNASWYEFYQKALTAVGILPSAQSEIIRCKDCKHRPTGENRDDLEFPDEICPCQCEDFWYNWKPKDEWYCGNGERNG